VPRLRSPLALIALGALLFAPATARAVGAPTVYDNHQHYLMGSRAAGMAGAYTALGCDEAALHYNPAALGCAPASRIELAANAYIIQAFDVPNAFGEEQDLEAINFHAIPSIVGGARILAEGDESGGRWVFGLSVEVPHSLVLKADPALPERPSFIAVSVIDNITTGDIGVGWQINEYVAVGLGIGAGLRTNQSRVDLLLTSRQPALCAGTPACFPFYGQFSDTDTLAIGGRAKLGVRVTPLPELSLGFAATSPSLDFWGRSKLVTTALFAGTDAMGNALYNPFPVRLEGDSALSMPLRLALGAAYSIPRFTVSLDVSLNFPHTVDAADELEQTVVEGFTPLPQEVVDEAELILDRTWQPNVNLGFEVGLTETVVLDFGAFTDLSSVSEDDVEEQSMDRVHMFGGTLGLGILGRQARAFFGVSFEMGRADTKVVPGTLDLESAAQSGFSFTEDSTITRWTLAGFLGSNYSFFKEDDVAKKAKD
jgi:hypothetical protein